MASASWNFLDQWKELHAERRAQDARLMTSGSALAAVMALFMIEALALNEDTHTFVVTGLLSVALAVGWLVAARRAGRREMRWAVKARGLEREVLRVPAQFALWEEGSGLPWPPWVALAFAMIALAAVWAGLVAYALGSTGI